MGLFSLFFLLICAVHLGSSGLGLPYLSVNSRTMDRLAIFYDRHKESGSYRDPAGLSITLEDITFTFLKTRETGFCKMYLEHEAFDEQYIRENRGQPYLFYDCEIRLFGLLRIEQAEFLIGFLVAILAILFLSVIIVCCLICWYRMKHHAPRPTLESSPAPSPPPPPSLGVVASSSSEQLYATILPYKKEILKRRSSLELPTRVHNFKSTSSLTILESSSSHAHWNVDEVQLPRPPVTNNSSSEESRCEPKTTAVLNFVEVPAKKSPTHSRKEEFDRSSSCHLLKDEEEHEEPVMV